MTAQQIFNDIMRFVGNDNYQLWYIGITSDIEERLFGAHRVHRLADRWIHAPAYNSAEARSVETALLQLGFDGGTGGGDHTCVNVYAYRKSPLTLQ